MADADPTVRDGVLPLVASSLGGLEAMLTEPWSLELGRKRGRSTKAADYKGKKKVNRKLKSDEE